MIAAVYARKSTEKNNVAEESKSVGRQVEHSRAYATKKGWTVADEHVYIDDGISGAEFANRAGFVRLMNALKPHPPFQALVMSEESRLGREQIEVSYEIKQLVTSGVRVFSYLIDSERTLDTPIEKAMLALQTMADEMEREGAPAGHRCDGPACPAGALARRLRVRLRPHRGKGCDRSGTARAARHRPASAKSYVDLSIAANSTHCRPRDESQWIRGPAPDLRIVSDDEWAAAHERLTTSRQNYLRRTDGRLWGRPANGVESAYLLTGMAVCGECGAGC